MYALDIGFRYLKAKKQSSVSVITTVAVAAVALGVASLLCVLSVTSGFQDVFRSKVVGVNSHVFIGRLGRFSEYRRVMDEALAREGVDGAAPFIIKPMMLAAGKKLSHVLVKGIDPVVTPTVLDLPNQLVSGSLVGLRLPGRRPVSETGSSDTVPTALEAYLARESVAWARSRGAAPLPLERPPEPLDETQAPSLPSVAVPSLDEASRVLAGLDDGGGLPGEDIDDAVFDGGDGRADQVPLGQLPGAVLGRELADRLDVEVGDRVRIVSPLAGLGISAWAAQARTPQSTEFRIIGIFRAGFHEYDSGLVYVDLYETQRLFDQGDTVTGVELRIENIDEAESIAKQLQEALGGAPFQTTPWAELNRDLFTALRIQKLALTIAIGSIILVAAFGVVATLFMMVLEKKREIAILKAMGARDGAVLTIFLFQGTVIGVVGTLIGLALGGGAIAYLRYLRLPLDPSIYLIDHLPVRVSGGEFVVTAVVATALCAMATIVPSFFAARLLPADGLRYE